MDLGYRGCELDGCPILHKDKSKQLSARGRCWLKLLQAVKSTISHLKRERRMRCFRLKGQLEDALNAVLAAVSCTCGG